MAKPFYSYTRPDISMEYQQMLYRKAHEQLLHKHDDERAAQRKAKRKAERKTRRSNRRKGVAK